MRNAFTDHNRTASKSIPLDNASGVKRSSRSRLARRRPFGRKRVKLDLSVKWNRLHSSSKIFWNHVPSPTPCSACDVTVRGRPTYGRHARIPASRNQFILSSGLNGAIMTTNEIKSIFDGSKVTNAQVLETNCTVLTSWRHAWTTRPRSASNTSRLP